MILQRPPFETWARRDGRPPVICERMSTAIRQDRWGDAGLARPKVSGWSDF
jgi:hypothetical protein